MVDSLYVINGENLKMDGGACFGVVPKTIWSKFCKADENNLIDVTLRSLLIKEGERLILIDTGCGDKQSEKFYSYLYVSGRNNMAESFARHGFRFEDVTDVILTHLHYDHCGGAVRALVANERQQENGEGNKPPVEYLPTFPNARYWCSKAQWDRANDPYPIEKASYYQENFLPLLKHGVLNFINHEMSFTPNVFFKIVNGHTSGQIIPIINYNGRKLVFMSDFIASSAHVNLTYIPSFDYEPLISLKEKDEFLKEAAKDNYILYFLHDSETECCTVEQTDKGIMVRDKFNLASVLS